MLFRACESRQTVSPMTSDAEIEAAVNGLYDALYNPSDWSDALHHFSRSVGARGCVFYPEKAPETILSLPISPGIVDFIDAFIRDGWHHRDTRAIRGWPLVAEGRPVLVVGARTAAGDTFHVHLVDTSGVDALVLLDDVGEVPLPPYITTRLDRPDRYQTVYATRPGSAAAPTAGLHLTPELLDRIRAAGATIHHVELVVGLDTFQPVSEPNPLDHRMHSERYQVPDATWSACQDAARVVAIGTTTVRALESAAASGQRSGRTELFLHQGSTFEVVDVLLTNFHLPRTTLLMMIDAFVGPRWRDLYATALAGDYRFLSFGDAMLLDRHAR